MDNLALSPAIANKYECTLQPGTYRVPGFGNIDLTTATVADADRLYSNGFPFLKLKPAPKAKAAPPAAKDEAVQVDSTTPATNVAAPGAAENT